MAVPCWRSVRYTDDGCSLYECLSCYNQWEGRTAPGWFDPFEKVPEPTSDSFTSTRTIDGVQVTEHIGRRDMPIYKPGWRFCPTCGVEWAGPIRCDVDNERMLGPRRAKILELVNEYYTTHSRSKESTYWWIIEERISYPGGEPTWEPVARFDPKRYDVHKIYKELLRSREEQIIEPRWFGVKEELRCFIARVNGRDWTHKYSRYNKIW